MSLVLRCEACGGAVVYDAGREAACCLFCGSTRIEREAEDEDTVRGPDAALTTRVDAGLADQKFREWASASWLTPRVLRSSAIQLRAMFLPAWWARGKVESHWSGTVPAETRSGRAPTSGVDVDHYEDMVSASRGLTQTELGHLQPFDFGDRHAWREESAAHPYEPPALSERASRAWLTERMRARHLKDVIRIKGLHDAVSSSLVHEEGHALYMVPIYIGTFRFRGRAWRFLVNAQSGELVGDAPVDRRKLALVSVGPVVLLAIILALARLL